MYKVKVSIVRFCCQPNHSVLVLLVYLLVVLLSQHAVRFPYYCLDATGVNYFETNIHILRYKNECCFCLMLVLPYQYFIVLMRELEEHHQTNTSHFLFRQALVVKLYLGSCQKKESNPAKCSAQCYREAISEVNNVE